MKSIWEVVWEVVLQAIMIVEIFVVVEIVAVQILIGLSLQGMQVVELETGRVLLARRNICILIVLYMAECAFIVITQITIRLLDVLVSEVKIMVTCIEIKVQVESVYFA